MDTKTKKQTNKWTYECSHEFASFASHRIFREEMALYASLKNIAVSSFEKNLHKYLQQATCGGVFKRKRNAWTVVKWSGCKLTAICLRSDRLLRAPSVLSKRYGVDVYLRSLNKPFYSRGLSALAFEWMWGWRWPCFDTNLICFVMEIVLEKY